MLWIDCLLLKTYQVQHRKLKLLSKLPLPCITGPFKIPCIENGILSVYRVSGAILYTAEKAQQCYQNLISIPHSTLETKQLLQKKAFKNSSDFILIEAIVFLWEIACFHLLWFDKTAVFRWAFEISLPIHTAIIFA